MYRLSIPADLYKSDIFNLESYDILILRVVNRELDQISIEIVLYMALRS